MTQPVSPPGASCAPSGKPAARRLFLLAGALVAPRLGPIHSHGPDLRRRRGLRSHPVPIWRGLDDLTFMCVALTWLASAGACYPRRVLAGADKNVSPGAKTPMAK